MGAPPWLGTHVDALKRFARTLRRMSVAVLLFYFVLTFWFTLIAFVKIDDRLGSQITQHLVSPEAQKAFAALAFQVSVAEWITTITAILALPVWALAAFLFWILLRMVVDLVYSFIYPMPRRDWRAYRVVLRVLYNTVGRRLTFSVVLGLPIVLLVYIKIGFFTYTFTELSRLIGKTMLIIVPLTYAWVWYQYARIRSTHPRATRYEDVLMSRNSLRRRFKNVIDGLVMLALLGWLVIPAYLTIVDRVTEHTANYIQRTGTYQLRHDLSTASVPPPNLGQSSSEWRPPTPKELREVLNPLAQAGNGEPIRDALPVFQRYLFLVVTLAGLLEIGIPVTMRTIHNTGYKATLKRILVHTVKTMVFVTVLQVIVKYGYFVDLGDPLGIGIMFSFLMSFFLAQESDSTDSSRIRLR